MSIFAGTGRLVRLALRRDRIKLPVWIFAVLLLVLVQVPALKEAYPSASNWVAYQQLLDTSAVGRIFAGNVQTPTFGAVVTAETLLYTGLIIAFMNTLLVVRHTRQNEELGSSELLQSARVGRYSALTSALFVAIAANIVIAAGMAIIMQLAADFSVSQAWLFGIGQAMLGLCFAAIAGVTAQLSGTGRSANSLASIVIGATFLLRGVGDILATKIDGVYWPHWASWLSPFGWLQLSEPLTLERWWPLAISAVFVVVATIVSYALLSYRDVGEGVLPARGGSARASRGLLAPLGLTIRLQKGVFLGWCISMVLMAAAMGAMAQQIVEFAKESDIMQQYIAALGGAGDIVEGYLSAILAMTAIIVSAYVIQALQRLRSEEVRGYTESIFGTASPRVSWMLSHVVVVVIGAATIVVAAGLAIAAGAGLSMGNPLSEWDLGSYAVAALSYAPALLLFAGIMVLFVGAIPRIAIGVTWAAFVFVAVVSQFGSLLKFPEWVIDISPFSHIEAAPADDIVVGPLVIFAAITAGLLLAGLVAFRRRDVVAG